VVASLKVEIDRLVGVGFTRCFVVKGLEMQLWLFVDTSTDCLGVFCMARIMFE
jgi:hypothetical protein